jgi:hypothetical protein
VDTGGFCFLVIVDKAVTNMGVLASWMLPLDVYPGVRELDHTVGTSILSS